MMGLIYRDKLFPRQAYARALTPWSIVCPGPQPGQRGQRSVQDLDRGRLPGMKVLRAAFTPNAKGFPEFVVADTPPRPLRLAGQRGMTACGPPI